MNPTTARRLILAANVYDTVFLGLFSVLCCFFLTAFSWLSLLALLFVAFDPFLVLFYLFISGRVALPRFRWRMRREKVWFCGNVCRYQRGKNPSKRRFSRSCLDFYRRGGKNWSTATRTTRAVRVVLWS